MHPQTWWHATQARICDRIEPFAHGTLARAADIPTYYDFNMLRVGPTDADAVTLAAEADRLLEGLDHRKVEADDEATGARLRPGFEALGWRAQRIAWLASSDPVLAAPPAGVEVGPCDRDDVVHLRHEWSEHWTPEQIDKFLPVEEKVVRRLDARVIAARRDGRADAIGFVQWRADGDTAEVMLAYVTPSERSSGVGGALIGEAVRLARAAGAEHFLIAADDEREAKRLYERLGFATVWVMHEFTRDPDPV